MLLPSGNVQSFLSNTAPSAAAFLTNLRAFNSLSVIFSSDTASLLFKIITTNQTKIIHFSVLFYIIATALSSSQVGQIS